MKEHGLTVPEIGLVAGTRFALGVGLGLLLAGRLGPEARRALGWGLVAVGVLTTPPLVAHVLGQGPPREADDHPEPGTRPAYHTSEVGP